MMQSERERKGFGKASVTAERDSFFPAAGQGDPEGFHPEIKLDMNATTLRGHSVCTLHRYLHLQG